MPIPTNFSRRFVASSITFTIMITAPLAATMGVYWQKSEIVPVVMVRPAISGFVPVDGTPIGNWSKDEVTPICLVRPSIGGFIPTDGSAIGNTWSKEDVKPYIEVEPTLSGFTAKDATDRVGLSVPSPATAVGSTLEDDQRPVAYVGLGSGHWIKKVSSAGRHVELEDGSKWEIIPINSIQTALWLPIMTISVSLAKTPIGEYKYVLKNTDSGETVLAKALGR